MTAIAVLFAVGGWSGVVLCGVRLRALVRERALVGQAAHELRGSGAAIALALRAVRRQPGGRRLVLIVESEFERLRTALDDLDAARDGRVLAPSRRVQTLDRVVRSAALGWRPVAARAGRAVHLKWEAGHAPVVADRGRLAQALGNLVGNAIEHGSGPVVLRARRRGAAVRVEVTDRGTWDPAPSGIDRGQGLRIARRAVRQSGGELTVRSSERGTIAAIELPVHDGEATDRTSGEC